MVVNCSHVEVVIGGHPPHIVVKNTTGCTVMKETETERERKRERERQRVRE